jgi:polar amino acid transport system substrate-binding protein
MNHNNMQQANQTNWSRLLIPPLTIAAIAGVGGHYILDGEYKIYFAIAGAFLLLFDNRIRGWGKLIAVNNYAVILAVLIFALSKTSGLATQPTPESPTDSIITIAVSATYPPFVYVYEYEGTGDIVGFDVSLIKDIVEREELEVEFVNVGWDALLAGVSTCKYDVAISAIAIPPEGTEAYLLSDPYFNFGQVVIVRQSESLIRDKNDLTGRIVGAQLGTISQIEAVKISGITLRVYDDTNLMLQDLMSNKIDAFITDNIMALDYTKQNPGLKVVGQVFTEEHLAIAVCKNRPDLLEAINHGLAEAKAEGVLDTLIQKWFEGKIP